MGQEKREAAAMADFARAPVLRHAQADPTPVAEAKQEVRALLSTLEGRAFAL